VITVLALYVVFGLIGTVRRYWSEYQAEQWRLRAEQATAPTWTEDDALLWLRQQGFDVLRRGEYEQSAVGQADEHGFLVVGGLYLDDGNFVFRPAWLDLAFLFDRDHRFRRVEARVWSHRPG
jgi:hypothetical protein